MILTLIILPCMASGDEDSKKQFPDPWYEVEAIIFTQTDNKISDDNLEVWPVDPGFPLTRDAISIVPLTPIPNSGLILPYALRPEETWQLGDIARRIEQKKQASVLMHLSWLQPAPPTDVSYPVKITLERSPPPGNWSAASDKEDIVTPEISFENELERPPELVIPSVKDVSPNPEMETSPEAEPASGLSLELARKTLEGTIGVSRNNYLHVKIDMIYRPSPDAQQSNLPLPVALSRQSPDISRDDTVEPVTDVEPLIQDKPTTPMHYRMKQRLRVKPNKVNYFDHPKFGILIQVRPFDPAPILTSQSTDASGIQASGNK